MGVGENENAGGWRAGEGRGRDFGGGFGGESLTRNLDRLCISPDTRLGISGVKRGYRTSITVVSSEYNRDIDWKMHVVICGGVLSGCGVTGL